jgi:hypothetical protein
MAFITRTVPGDAVYAGQHWGVIRDGGRVGTLGPMATGPRPPSQSDHLEWPGPRQRGRRGGQFSTDEVIDQLLTELGAGSKVLAESRLIGSSGILPALAAGKKPARTTAIGRLRAGLGGTDPSAWLAASLAKRAWALSRAMYMLGAAPVFAETPERLVPGCAAEVGGEIKRMLRRPTTPRGSALVKAFGGPVTDAWHGYAALGMLAEAEVDELASILDGWEQSAVWALVYPGLTPPGPAPAF